MTGSEADGPLSDQVPKGAPLNFQGKGEVQKAKQPSYAAVAGRAMVPRPRVVTAAQDRPVGATGATVQGGYMFECTDQTEAECLERMLFGAPKIRLPEMKEHIKVGSTVFLYNKEAKVVMGPYSAI